MSVSDVLADGFGRIREVVHAVLDGLTVDDLCYRIDPQANSIGWLIWHLTRIQDDHLAGAAGLDQVWPEGWQQRADLPYPPMELGYGQDPAAVSQLRLPGEFLAGYHDATYTQTIAVLGGWHESDLSRIVDRSFSPPVTLGVRLVSVLADDFQHAGQAAFVRGIVERLR